MTREEAIKKLRQMTLPEETMEILEALAPELKESEDERTRKEIIEFIRSQIEDGNSAGWDRWIAYLEKQKEQKPSDEQPVEGLEEEYQEFCKDTPFPWSSQYVNREYIDELCLSVARHFAEWGAEHLKTPTP